MKRAKLGMKTPPGIDIRKIVLAAAEAALDQQQSSPAKDKKPRRGLPAVRALLLGAGVVTAGRAVMSGRGHGIANSLQERLGDLEDKLGLSGDEAEGEEDFEDEELEEPEAYEDEEPEAYEDEEPEDYEEPQDSEQDEEPEDYEDEEPEDSEEGDYEDEDVEDDDEEPEESDDRPRRQKAGSRSKRQR